MWEDDLTELKATEILGDSWALNVLLEWHQILQFEKSKGKEESEARAPKLALEAKEVALT
jgi:hypothetical protein